jgi:hypothetical protein
MRKAMEAGMHREIGPASPPGVEVTARVEGALTQSREGLGGSPYQVVGQKASGITNVLGKAGGAIETGGSGRSSEEERDNRTLSEQRTRGPRWLLKWPEAWLVENAG